MNHHQVCPADPSNDTSCRVEVSGWDAAENFFVEKATLSCSDGASKEVLLRSSLREGSIVFIRLNQSVTDRILPMAHRAQKISPRDARGLIRVSLTRLRPCSEHHVGKALPEGNGSTGAAQLRAELAEVESCERPD